jgi:fatty-acyl-CoA synthase
VTAVGKPYKLPLRAHAARAAVTDALAAATGVTGVGADTEDGQTVVTVAVDRDADRQAIDDILARFTLTYRITEH